MRYPSAAPLAFGAAMLTAVLANARSSPPRAVEHRPPEALQRPAPHPARLVRPGQSLPLELILRWPRNWREMRERRAQIEAFDVQL